MWLISFIKSSIGKKIVMASSGFLLILFLAIHAFGNAAIYMGSKYFQIYADTLHGFPVLVLIFSVGLLVIIAAHICVGVLLFLESRSERYSRYAVQTRVVENTFASRTMPYTGLFILFSLLSMCLASISLHPPISRSVHSSKSASAVFFYSLFYIIAFIALAIHLNHGFWSMLQTFGFNHPKYNYLIAKLTIIVPIFFLVLFGGIPIYFMTGAGAAY